MIKYIYIYIYYRESGVITRGNENRHCVTTCMYKYKYINYEPNSCAADALLVPKFLRSGKQCIIQTRKERERQIIQP